MLVADANSLPVGTTIASSSVTNTRARICSSDRQAFAIHCQLQFWHRRQTTAAERPGPQETFATEEVMCIPDAWKMRQNLTSLMSQVRIEPAGL